MVDFSDLLEGFIYIAKFKSLLMITLGVGVGIVIGAIPGLTTTMGMAIFVPLTFFMEPLLGIPFLLGLYKGGIYGGSIPAILISTPGTGAAVATIADGYALSQQGRSKSAIEMALIASTIGDTFGSLVIIFFAESVTILTRTFGAAELFAILVFSLVVISSTSADNIAKGLISLSLGLILSTVGIDTGGRWRFTFGIVDLGGGLPYVCVLIGLFAFSVVIEEVAKSIKEKVIIPAKFNKNDKVSMKEFLECLPAIIRSSFIGTFIGIIPGIGQPVAAFLGHSQAKRFSKHPELVGKGSLEGVAGAEAGNNAVNGPCLLPLLSLGIPGDIIGSILLGAFLAQGMRPGPNLFIEHGSTMYALLVGLGLANIALYIIGRYMSLHIAKLVMVPKYFIIPTVFVLTVVGSFAINNSWFDVLLMVLFGFIGYYLKKFDVPLAPLVIGFILTHSLETNLIRSMIIFEGNILGFLNRPIAMAFLLATAVILIYPTVIKVIKK